MKLGTGIFKQLNYVFFFCVKYCVLMFLFSESMLEVIQKKITEAFDIFDHESNKTVAITYVCI